MSLLWISCELYVEKVSIPERIDHFIYDLNSDYRVLMYKNIHPDADMYTSLKLPGAWDVYFPPGVGYRVMSNRPDAEGVVDTYFAGGPLSGTAVKFYMKEDGADNWMIIKINMLGSDIIK
jgi:hypothetical protein